MTHTDARAVQGARFVAEMCAGLMHTVHDETLDDACERALAVVDEPALSGALRNARVLARDHASTADAVAQLGCSGYVVHSVAIALFCFLRYGRESLAAIQETIRAGGDTDTNAAIVGAWVGALHGAEALPRGLLLALHDRDWVRSPAVPAFAGPTHLRQLAQCLAGADRGLRLPVTRFSRLGAMLRNLALYPVVLAHAFRIVVQRAIV